MHLSRTVIHWLTVASGRSFNWRMYLLLPLIAALAFAFGSMVFKRAFLEGAGLAHLMVVNNVILGLAFGPLFLLESRPLSWNEWHRPAITGFTFAVGHILSLVALRFGDVSVATPLLGSKILFVALIGWILFDAQLTAGQWLSAVLATGGVISMGLTDVRSSGRMGLTTLASLGCAAAFAVTDMTIQAWGGAFGVWSFLSLQFLWLALFSLATLPIFGIRSLRAPNAAWRWILLGVAFSGAQALLVTSAIAIWKDAIGVNVVYATRGLWSIALVGCLGGWMKNRESRDAGPRKMALRIFGALLIFAAAVLSVRSSGH